MVGEVISTVALAGQISREFSVSDHGIDMEIELSRTTAKPPAEKSICNSNPATRSLASKRDDAEIFTIKDERHARYWMEQAFPVMLVIRNSEGKSAGWRCGVLKRVAKQQGSRQSDHLRGRTLRRHERPPLAGPGVTRGCAVQARQALRLSEQPACTPLACLHLRW